MDILSMAWELFFNSGWKVWLGEYVTSPSSELMFTLRGCLASDSSYHDGCKKYQQEKDMCTQDLLLNPNGRI